ncbi:MAG TPA: circularly permuted type 2 ATP-grasp protein [Acidimicrobiales bacterium]|nr:circularly permuted type 2 ATP-grasp protein [Acidimicrobiales bacterium]
MTIAPSPDLLASYRGAPGAYDEMLATDGRIREHWAHASRAIADLGLDELLYRKAEARRLLDDDGVTYNVYSGDLPSDAPAPFVAPWPLDPVPVLLASDEWAGVEHGVVQRAELFNLVLTDLYGPRQLLRRGLLPAELVLGHRAFLRQCDQVRLPGTQQLFTMAMDLVRDPSGRCTVLADRTEAPSGAGYALENRVVVSRVLPSLYRDCQVHRLAPFFRALRASLQGVAPPGTEDPRIVLLSPGPWSETAFEHAYLASHLGYPLVEASDLTVRDGRLWMRSLHRLERVDVVLRRTEAWWCDPLELRGDSRLGVPGLVEACRLGAVSVVNTLGSGVLENPGLLPYLPRLAEYLLGEQLVLPSVPTWWCGEEQSRRHVLARLSSLVVKPVVRGAGPTAVFPSELSRQGQEELARCIEAQPGSWVGQEALEPASAPTLTPSGLEARQIVLRTFAVARQDSYAVMPGGLTRVAAGADGGACDGRGVHRPRISNQAGAISKDTWVLASEPEKLSGFWLVPGPPVAAIDPAASMSSRAAENLFWMGRYAERAEAMARLVRAAHDRRNDFQHGANPAGTECLRVLLTALTQVSATYPGFVGQGAASHLAAPGAELFALVVDDKRPGTLAHAVRHLSAAAQAVRDQLSGDTWMAVGALERQIEDLRTSDPDHLTVVQHTLGRIVQGLLALSGMFGEGMERDPGWRFMDAGRRLERGQQLLALLQATITIERSTATDSLLLESVLIAAESIITYRRRYRSQAQLETLLDLLLSDQDNPRSVAHQLDELAADVHLMPRVDKRSRLSEPERLVLEASTTLRVADTALLAQSHPDGTHPELDDLLSRLRKLFYRAAEAIDEDHFVHLLPQRSLLGS